MFSKQLVKEIAGWILLTIVVLLIVFAVVKLAKGKPSITFEGTVTKLWQEQNGGLSSSTDDYVALTRTDGARLAVMVWAWQFGTINLNDYCVIVTDDHYSIYLAKTVTCRSKQ